MQTCTCTHAHARTHAHLHLPLPCIFWRLMHFYFRHERCRRMMVLNNSFGPAAELSPLARLLNWWWNVWCVTCLRSGPHLTLRHSFPLPRTASAATMSFPQRAIHHLLYQYLSTIPLPSHRATTIARPKIDPR